MILHRVYCKIIEHYTKVGFTINFKYITIINHFRVFKYGAIFSLNDKPLKLVEQFTYLGSNISATESDANIYIGKAWTVIYRLTAIRQSDHFDKIKWIFFQAIAMSVLISSHQLDFDEMPGEKTRWELHKEVACCLEQILKRHLTKQRLHGYLPPISQSIQARYVGNWWRSKDELISDILQWSPIHR